MMKAREENCTDKEPMNSFRQERMRSDLTVRGIAGSGAEDGLGRKRMAWEENRQV